MRKEDDGEWTVILFQYNLSILTYVSYRDES